MFGNKKAAYCKIIMLYATFYLCFYKHYQILIFQILLHKIHLRKIRLSKLYLILAMSISVSFWISVFSRLVIRAFAVSIAVSTLTPVSIAFLRITNPSLE